MSHRALLPAEQRDRLFAIPVERAEMAQHYVLGADDLALIRSKRRGMNRLGFAVQLCLLRYPGQGLGPGDRPPEAMIAFVAEQVGAPPSAFADYALRDQTRREHTAELQAALGMRRFGFAGWRTCLRVGADAAWATDRGEPIVRAMLEHLRAARVLIPAPTVLERIGLEARVRARRTAFQTLASGLTDADSEKLVGLLAHDPGCAPVLLRLVARLPESPAPSNMIELLDRLDLVRGLGISPDRARRIHPARLGRLVDEGATMTAQHIADLEPVRRSAILVAQVADLQTRLADATLAMFEKYIGSLFTKARGKDERRFQATKRDVAKALLLFRRTIFALKQAKATRPGRRARRVDREIGMAVSSKACPAGDRRPPPTSPTRTSWSPRPRNNSVLRRFSPFGSWKHSVPRRARRTIPCWPPWNCSRTTDTRVFAKRPPASFASGQVAGKLIFASGAADRRLHETAVLATVLARPAARERHLGGRQPRRPRVRGLFSCPSTTPQTGAGSTARPTPIAMSRRAERRLHERLQFVAACAARGELDGVEIEAGEKLLHRAHQPTTPEAARLLAARLESLLPRVRITEVPG